jgi:hypothetical protein
MDELLDLKGSTFLYCYQCYRWHVKAKEQQVKVQARFNNHVAIAIKEFWKKAEN